MSKEDEIRELYANGYRSGEMPQWFWELKWNHPLWVPTNEESIEETLRRYCESFLSTTPDITIYGAGGDVYMERYRVAESHEKGSEGPFSEIYLNHFRRSDADLELHSHPWDRSLSLILLNGYEEERRHTKTSMAPGLIQCRHQVVHHQRKPGDVLEVNADTFHRVDLPHGDAWTLFFVGKYIGTWHFWNRTTGRTEQWADFLRARGRLGQTTSGPTDKDYPPGRGISMLHPYSAVNQAGE